MPHMKKMKPIIKNLTWALGLLFLTPSHAGTSCENLLKIHLQDSQRDLLLQAKNDYQVEILTGRIADKERTIVFLGKTNLKDSKQAITSEFHFRGFEGVRTDRTWGSKILARSLDLIYPFVLTTSLEEQDQDDTDDDPEETAVLQKMLARIDNYISEEELSQQDLESIVVTIDGYQVSYPEFSAKLKTHPIINVHLQADHRPGLAQNLQSVLLPTSFLLGVGALGAAALDLPFPGNAISAATGGVTTPILALAGTQLVFRTISNRLRNTSLLFQSYLYRGRNQTMVKNITAAFERHREQNIILVIVSRPYIAGMKKILKSQMGFEEQSLEN